MKRALFYVLTGLVLLTVAAGVMLLWPAKPVSSGQLTLPDRSVVRIMAVTYGTNHVVGPVLACLVDRWPPRVQALAKRLLGARVSPPGRMATSEPRMVVWLDRNINGAAANVGSGYFYVALADESGFVSGGRTYMGGGRASLLGLDFQVAPRRDRESALQFSYHGPGGSVTNGGGLSFRNPLSGRYPQWTPEALPATRRVGDLEVTLEQLSTGHGEHTHHHGLPGGRKVIEFGESDTEGRNTSVCVMRLRSLTDPGEVWRVTGVRLGDATGNWVRNEGMSWGGEGEDYFTFTPGLWTNESAWRLECEIKRTRNFRPEELLIFRNVPLGALDARDAVGWTSNVLGAVLTLDHIVRRPPNTNDSWSSSNISQVKFTFGVLATNTHLDLLRMVMDTGQTNTPGSWSSSSSERTYSFQTIPLEARTADFIFAFHTSRWAQFTVKPEVRTARLEYPSRPKGR
jgi:hypothetical protein